MKDMFMGYSIGYGVDVRFLWYKSDTTGTFLAGLFIFMLFNVLAMVLKIYRKRFLDEIVNLSSGKMLSKMHFWVSFFMTLLIYSITAASMLVLMSFNCWVLSVFVVTKYIDVVVQESKQLSNGVM